MKKQILFVDDDPGILERLSNRLRRQRQKWEMFFVESGKKALEILETQPMDVIVSDMRMPEMDGATLLKRVQEKHPHVARIILSGHAELESALRAVPVAHQFLTKPCEPGVLESVVERACGLQSLLNDEKVRRIVGKIEKLPPVPSVYARLTSALANEETSIDSVTKILKQDMALCAKVLQVVNSGFFRLARKITRIEDAVCYLGFNSIRQLALAAEAFHHPQPGALLIPLGELQSHALLVGNLASQFFEQKQMKEDAFVAGLLHDIGKLVMVVELSKLVELILQVMRKNKVAMHEAEKSLLGISHAEVGGYLLGLWGLPYPVVEAVANHHDPTRVAASEFGLLAAAHIADALAGELAAGGAVAPPSSRSSLDMKYVESLGVGDRLKKWRELARGLAESGQL